MINFLYVERPKYIHSIDFKINNFLNKQKTHTTFTSA